MSDYSTGDLVEVFHSGVWYKSKIVSVDYCQNQFKIHFIGWKKRHDQKYSFGTQNVRPFVENLPTPASVFPFMKKPRKTKRKLRVLDQFTEVVPIEVKEEYRHKFPLISGRIFPRRSKYTIGQRVMAPFSDQIKYSAVIEKVNHNSTYNVKESRVKL